MLRNSLCDERRIFKKNSDVMYTTPPICTWYLKCRIVVLWIVEHKNLVGAAVKYVLNLVKSHNMTGVARLATVTWYVDWRVLIIWFESFRRSSSQCWYNSLNDSVNLRPFCGTLANRPSLTYSIESGELFIWYIIYIGTQTCWKRPPNQLQEEFIYVHTWKRKATSSTSLPRKSMLRPLGS